MACVWGDARGNTTGFPSRRIVLKENVSYLSRCITNSAPCSPPDRRQQEGCLPLQDAGRAVPLGRERRWKQDRPCAARSVRPENGFRRWLRLHGCQQAKGHHLVRRHAGTSHRLSPSPHPGVSILTWPSVRIPREPQEVYPRHQDGLRWSEEGEGPERPDHVCFIFSSCFFRDALLTCPASYLKESTN